MEEKTNQNNTIDLRHLWQLVRQNIIQILIWTIGLGIVAYALADFIITPKYSSQTQILVNQKKAMDDPNAAFAAQQANMQLVNTYKDIITGPVILKDASNFLANPVKVVRKAQKAVYKRNEDGTRRLVRLAKPAVIERSGKSYTVPTKQMQKAVTVQTQQQSQVFTLAATANTPQKAQAIADAVAQSFKKKIPSIMNANNVTIVSDANLGTRSFPNTKLFTLAGLVLGLIISIGLILLKDSLNTTVRTDNFMTNELGLTNLGTVTHFHLSNSFKIKQVAPANSTENNREKRRRRV